MKKKPHKHIEQIDCGKEVVCDICNRSYTDSDERGGFVWETWAYCPVCAPSHMHLTLKKGAEFEFCPKGLSFREFILKYRGGDGIITIVGSDDPNLPEGCVIDIGQKNTKKITI